MSGTDLKPGYEQVFTMTDYWDGPLQGIANFEGRPHLYERIFDEAKDDYLSLYRLTPVSSEIFQLALEDWEIWLRWEEAFHAGRTDRDTHPALPQDRKRHEELKIALDSSLRTDLVNCIVRQGYFEVIENPSVPKGVMRRMQVSWTEERESVAKRF